MLHHSPETQQNLLTRIPEVTGHDIGHWLARLDDGPSLLRFEERVTWLSAEHELPHSFATALVHEQDMRRRTRVM